MRKPAKIAGMPAGSWSCQSRVKRLASCSVNRSCWPWSADKQPEQRVGDDREDRDQHADDHSAAEVEVEPERRSAARGRGSGWSAAPPRRGRATARSTSPGSSDGEEHAEHDRDGEADQRDLRRAPQAVEQLVAVVRSRRTRRRSRGAAAASGTAAEASSSRYEMKYQTPMTIHEDDERPDDLDEERLPRRTAAEVGGSTKRPDARRRPPAPVAPPRLAS